MIAASETTHSRLTGWQGDRDYFRFLEYDSFDPEPVVDVLRGKVAGVIFRGVVAGGTRRELIGRFWHSPARKPWEGIGYSLGSFHYYKSTKTYLDESEDVAEAVDAVLNVPDEPSRWFRERLRHRLAEDGIAFRLAEKDGRRAGEAFMVHWNATDRYALKPHEDMSECREPGQADFEIQGTTNYAPCAVNICLENGDGGRLIYWNIIPDDASKTRLGVYYSGSSYPTETLIGIEAIWLKVQPGDIYVFNGSHVHGIEATTQTGKRTTSLFRLGFVDDQTVVTWT
jgi:hypothetical protein